MDGKVYDFLSRKKEEIEQDIKVSIVSHTICFVLETWLIFTGLDTIEKYSATVKGAFGLALIVFGIVLGYLTAKSLSERVHAHIQKFWNCISVLRK